MRATVEIRMTPPPECSPNWRGHTKSKAKQRAVACFRAQAGWATRVAILRDLHAFWWVPTATTIMLDVEIAWPRGRRRIDDDNAWGSMKPALDGIAEAFGINDRRFLVGTLTQTRGEGVVTVTLRDQDDVEATLSRPTEAR